jgi:hypothetical protein
MEDFIPGLEPLGSLSLKWLDCIGERFADAVKEFCDSSNAVFMGTDVVDQQGEDIYVSRNCRNQVTGARWTTLTASLAP